MGVGVGRCGCGCGGWVWVWVGVGVGVGGWVGVYGWVGVGVCDRSCTATCTDVGMLTNTVSYYYTLTSKSFVPML